MLTRLSTGLRNSVHEAAACADALLHETTLRLAVTGLARAGKTVFVTSLLANLLALGRRVDALPLLRQGLEYDAGGGESSTRLQEVRLVPPRREETPLFEFTGNLATLTAPAPAWPPRTEDLTETAVELELGRTGVRSVLGSRRLRLEILDYPGEWLLDLPLLDQPFATWSRDTLARLRRGARAAIFAPFLAQLADVAPGDDPQHVPVRHLHELYRNGLRAAQTEHGLRLLQPGRFLCPGPRADAPFLWFFPLAEAPEHPRRGTLAYLLQDRFEAYKADMRTSFFNSHFARFDRQAMLVDVLGALHGGREAFEDTGEALAAIAGALSYGRWNLGRARHGRIDRVAFAATKADHVPAIRRENLRNLLRDLVEPAREPMRDGPVSYHTVASILSTQDATTEQNGLVHDVVRGRMAGSGAEKLFDPGTVPAGRPPDSFWERRRFVLPVFEPPRGEGIGPNGIPNLGLDGLLATLLKGRL